MDGILLIDKPTGMTSHDVVSKIRKDFGFKKVGHAGTLDPLATGLLILLLGKATKRSLELSNHDKVYETTLELGRATDTGDSDGRLIEKKDSHVTPDEVGKVLKNFIGEIQQVPPMYSAKKYKGKKLYEYARLGVEVERAPRRVLIKKIEILKFSGNKLSLRIHCSKGTYIRQMAVDIGSALGCGAHVTALRRTVQGNFSVDQALTLEKIDKEGMRGINENIIQL